MKDFHTPDAKGDRTTLSFSDRELLETQILPTAHRWLKLYPNLRRAAQQTLDYWNEPHSMEAAE